MIPTVGFNMRKITKGNVTIKVRDQSRGCGVGRRVAEVTSRQEEVGKKGDSGVLVLLLRPSHPLLAQLWDIGGQPRFRSMWERYCRGVSAIV